MIPSRPALPYMSVWEANETRLTFDNFNFASEKELILFQWFCVRQRSFSAYVAHVAYVRCSSAHLKHSLWQSPAPEMCKKLTEYLNKDAHTDMFMGKSHHFGVICLRDTFTCIQIHETAQFCSAFSCLYVNIPLWMIYPIIKLRTMHFARTFAITITFTYAVLMYSFFSRTSSHMSWTMGISICDAFGTFLSVHVGLLLWTPFGESLHFFPFPLACCT